MSGEPAPVIRYELRLLSEFSQTTWSLGFRLQAAEGLQHLLHWTAEHRLEHQLGLHCWGAVWALLDVIRSEGLTSNGVSLILPKKNIHCLFLNSFDGLQQLRSERTALQS